MVVLIKGIEDFEALITNNQFDIRHFLGNYERRIFYVTNKKMAADILHCQPLNAISKCSVLKAIILMHQSLVQYKQ